MKKIIIWLSIVIILAVGLLFYFNYFKAENRNLWEKQPASALTGSVNIGTRQYEVEMVASGEKLAKGLSGREKIGENEGMLFVFQQESKPVFWMKDMKFPLDIIWVKDKKVVDITKNVPIPAGGVSDEQLPSYQPKENVNMVLEINAGQADKYNFQIGDEFSYSTHIP